MAGVNTDGHGICIHYPDGTILLIPWDVVQCVAIEINGSGPSGADVWWLIEGNQSRCAYRGGATADIDALRALESRLTGFDDECVVRAIGCTSNRRFVCWQRSCTMIPGGGEGVEGGDVIELLSLSGARENPVARPVACINLNRFSARGEP